MSLLKEVFSTSATRAFLSIVMGFLVGAIFMMVSSEDVGKALESGGLMDAIKPHCEPLPMGTLHCFVALSSILVPMT